MKYLIVVVFFLGTTLCYAQDSTIVLSKEIFVYRKDVCNKVEIRTKSIPFYRLMDSNTDIRSIWCADVMGYLIGYNVRMPDSALFVPHVINGILFTEPDVVISFYCKNNYFITSSKLVSADEALKKYNIVSSRGLIIVKTKKKYVVRL